MLGMAARLALIGRTATASPETQGAEGASTIRRLKRVTIQQREGAIVTQRRRIPRKLKPALAVLQGTATT